MFQFSVAENATGPSFSAIAQVLKSLMDYETPRAG
jgi:hypothetical protein